MPEFNANLWAPWRMEYIRSFADEAEEGCFLCRYWQNPDDDARNYVLWRTTHSLIVMNRFPYTNGHLLVAHAAHKGDLTDLSDEALADIAGAIRDAEGVLRTAFSPHGFNIGFNVGRCAGAGLPGHLHAHIVPRWSGDTNFMAVIGDSRVIPDALDAAFAELSKHAETAGLRS